MLTYLVSHNVRYVGESPPPVKKSDIRYHTLCGGEDDIKVTSLVIFKRSAVICSVICQLYANVGKLFAEGVPLYVR